MITNILESRSTITLDNFDALQRHRHHLKLLVALSSLLVRNHEIVAIMAKRIMAKSNISGTAVFLGSNSQGEADVAGLDIPDNASTTPSISRLANVRLLSPRFGYPDRPCAVVVRGPGGRYQLRRFWVHLEQLVFRPPR